MENLFLSRNVAMWYVQFKRPDNSFSTPRSTKKTNRYEAERLCIEYMKSGNVVVQQNVTFESFSHNFFEWKGSWAMDKRVRGLRISERQCSELDRILKKKVIPALGKMRLSQIDRSTIKKFRNDLFAKGFAGNTINLSLSVIKAILEEAEEKGLVRGIPRIDRAAKNSKHKGILTIEEVRKLFSIEWEDPRSHAASILAASTGLRLGEVLGLVFSDYSPEERRIFCRRSWDQSIRRLNHTTKTGKVRNIFIPETVVNTLNSLISRNPYHPIAEDSFIFYADKSTEYPTEPHTITNGFYKALESIGITENIRRMRNITFHSHRHFLNSLLINSNIPLQKIQSITGHLTQEMTQHYYHLDEMEDVQRVQERLFS